MQGLRAPSDLDGGSRRRIVLDDIITWFVLTSTHMEIRVRHGYGYALLKEKRGSNGRVTGTGDSVKITGRDTRHLSESHTSISLSIAMGKRWSLGVLEDAETTEVPGTRVFTFFTFPPRGVEFLLTRRDKRHRSPAHIYYTRASRSR